MDTNGQTGGQMTLKELADKSGQRYNSVWRKAVRKYPDIAWTADTELQPDIAAELSGKKKRTVRRTTPVLPSVKMPVGQHRENAPVVDIQPDKGPDVNRIRRAAFDLTCISIVFGHAVLIWYDCAAMWGTPGLIAGGIAFLVVLATLLIATDNTRERTSETALWVVFLIDVSAWWIHYPTFLRSANIGEVQTGALAALLCAFSFAALYIYRDSKID